MYILANMEIKNISKKDELYPGIQKIKNMENYSSKTVEKISIKELKNIITSSNLIP